MQAMKEISGKAGYAGIMDLIIVVVMFILAFSVLNTSSVLNTIGGPNDKAPIYTVLILFAAAVVFIASLKIPILDYYCLMLHVNLEYDEF